MRPRSISILCSILFILIGLALFGSVQGLMIVLGINEFDAIEGRDNISNAVLALSVPAAIYGFIANILTLVSIYGLWKMKKWGIYLFATIIGIGLFVRYIISPSWVVINEELWWLPLILPVIYMCVVIPNWKQLKGSY